MQLSDPACHPLSAMVAGRSRVARHRSCWWGVLGMVLIHAAFALASCVPSVANPRSAKILPPESDALELGTAVTGVRRLGDNAVKVSSIDAFDIAYVRSLSENFEVGFRGKVPALNGAMNLKLRLLHVGKLHLAVDPQIGAVANTVFSGWATQLAVAATVELGEHSGINVAPFVGYSDWEVSEAGQSDAHVAQFGGKRTSYGVTLSFDLAGDFAISPGIELTQYRGTAVGGDDFLSAQIFFLSRFGGD